MLPSSSSAIAAMASCGKNMESDPIGAPRLELLAWLPTLASLRIPADFADAPRCTHKLCVWDDLKYAPPE